MCRYSCFIQQLFNSFLFLLSSKIQTKIFSFPDTRKTVSQSSKMTWVERRLKIGKQPHWEPGQCWTTQTNQQPVGLLADPPQASGIRPSPPNSFSPWPVHHLQIQLHLVCVFFLLLLKLASILVSILYSKTNDWDFPGSSGGKNQWLLLPEKEHYLTRNKYVCACALSR